MKESIRNKKCIIHYSTQKANCKIVLMFRDKVPVERFMERDVDARYTLHSIEWLNALQSM